MSLVVRSIPDPCCVAFGPGREESRSITSWRPDDPTHWLGAAMIFPFALESGWVTHWRVGIEGKGEYDFNRLPDKRVLTRKLEGEVAWSRILTKLEPAGSIQTYYFHKTMPTQLAENENLTVIDPSLRDGGWFSIMVLEGKKDVYVGFLPPSTISQEQLDAAANQ